MPRIKRGVAHIKRRKNILKKTKGYRHGRKNLIRQAKTAINKAGQHAYRDRKKKKRRQRRLWNVQINAGARHNGTTYSRLINALKKNQIELDRKALANLAGNHPKIFAKIVEETLNQ